MKFYIALVGGTKHDAALLMPCGSYQFQWCPEVDRHVLDGGPVTLERFNEVTEDLARRWQHENSRFRWAPMIHGESEAPHDDAQIEELRRQLTSKDAIIADLRKRQVPRRLVSTHPAAEEPPQPPTDDHANQ